MPYDLTLHPPTTAQHTPPDSQSRCLLNRLPPEILCYIFQQGAHIPRKRYNISFAILVSHVCQAWRRTALGLPYMWSTIDAVIMDEVESDPQRFERQQEYLARSQDHPLQIYLSVQTQNHTSFADKFLLRVAQCSHRWERVEIAMSDPVTEPFLRQFFVGLHLPNLQAFNISRWWFIFHAAQVPQESLIGDVPGLRYLRQYCVYHLPYGSFGESLLQAEFMRTYDQLAMTMSLDLDFLVKLAEAAPRLEHLAIWCAVTGPPSTVNTFVDIKFPALRSLRLLLGEFDGRGVIIAPNLEYMAMVGYRRPMELVSFLTPVVARPPDMRFQNVRHLHLHDFSDNHPGIGKLFTQAFGSVTTLHLGDVPTSSLFCALSTATSDGSMPWPLLRRFAIMYADTEDLLQLVRARLDSPLDVLETNLYTGNDPRGYQSIPQRNDVTALMRLVHMAPLPDCIDEFYETNFDVQCSGCDWGEDWPTRNDFPLKWIDIEESGDDESMADGDGYMMDGDESMTDDEDYYSADGMDGEVW